MVNRLFSLAGLLISIIHIFSRFVKRKGIYERFSPDKQTGNAGPRLVLLRFPARHRRRICRPPLVRHRDHLARAGGRGLQGRYFEPAGFPRRARLHRHGPPALRGADQRRQYRLHGRALHGGQKAPLGRRLHPGRPGGQAPGPRGDRLCHARAARVPGCAGLPRRHRGQPAPLCAL